MKKTINILLKFFLGFLGIVLISCTPVLFAVNNSFDIQIFISTLIDLCKELINPTKWHLNYRPDLLAETIPLSFSNYLKGPYLYSMTILSLSLILSFFVSFISAITTMMTNGSIKRILLNFIRIFESFPDFAFVFLIQIVVVQVYLSSNKLLLQFYSLGDDLVYLAPIICLSALPTLLLTKLFILLFEGEWEQPYVDLAKSKGLGKVDILIRHCTSNVIKSLFIQSKSIVWLTLSSLFIIEYLFGIEGILHYLRSDFSPKGIALILFSIYIPFFIYYSLIEVNINKSAVKRNAIFEKFNFSFLNFQQLQSLKQTSRVSFKFPKKQMNIIVPLTVITVLLLISIFYSLLFKDRIDQINFLYSDNGKLLGTPPFPPSRNVLFGTDPYGFSILQQVLVGIKYTILITLFIATIRIVMGYLFGIVYAFYLSNKWRRIISGISDGMHFLPLTVLVYILLLPVLINTNGEWDSTLWERLLLQSLIMSIIVLPITTSVIGNEMDETLKKEYVQSSVVMGGSVLWVLIKHINPQLWSKLILFWTQHIVQVLQMFVHLGILSIFVGGAAYYADTPYRLIPDIYELSGMIAISREVFVTNQFWMILPPLIVFMLLIFSFNTIAEGISKKPKVPIK